MSTNCPYCEIKELSNIKEVFESLEHTEGTCPDCGARLDKGQQRVEINGYTDIYKGAIRLMQKMTDEFNYWLDYFDIDVDEHMEDGEKPQISINTSKIISELFTPYAGGTTIMNLKKAMDIEQDTVEFDLLRNDNWK